MHQMKNISLFKEFLWLNYLLIIKIWSLGLNYMASKMWYSV
jgi:hypothetical protein